MSKINKVILYITFLLSIYSVLRIEYINYKRLEFENKVKKKFNTHSDEINNFDNDIENIKNSLLDIE